MPRTKILNLLFGDIAPTNMTLQLDCWQDELSPAQLAAFEQAEKEHNDIKSKLDEVVTAGGGEKLFLGEIFSAYEVAGPVAGLEKIAKPAAAVRKENRAKQLLEEKKIRTEREREASRKRDSSRLIEIEDDDDDDDDDEYLPLSKRSAAAKKAQNNRKEPPKATYRGKVSAAPEKPSARPSENTAVGGLTIGEAKKKEIVDLTKDEPAGAKSAADSREVTFNKLQGKTFPSLVVVARATLKAKETNINDRPALDSKVKSVLMHTATKYTEWLIQQGLVRSDQTCQNHLNTPLKLGMYSDASKFPYSGGYVWISDCCPSRFVSVFNGSLFEGASHPPSVLLKLIYHWSCQTNVQNVVQWVKVENSYVKGLFTWLRSVCTVALHQHMTLLGGQNKRIEVGVISLGTTSQGGHQKQVKVEVLGILDPVAKIVRLRAVEPLTDGEKNYKKRFAKILEPLSSWVHKDSTILTDLTVDKGTLHAMGYKHVNQSVSADGKYTNYNIMDYLRTVVPRMFQNTLSLLSRQIIQQFLDELVWREWYGTTPGKTFDNIVSHISEQTRLDARETLVNRLTKVAANPFKNWSHFSVKSPAKALRADFFTSGSSNSIPSTSPIVSSSNRNRSAVRSKRKEPSPPPAPPKKQPKVVVKEEFAQKYKVKIPSRKEEVKEVKEPTIFLESYYYGLYETGTENDTAVAVTFEANCPECHEIFTGNTEFMTHLKGHASPPAEESEENAQCRYCLSNFTSTDSLNKHISDSHPIDSKEAANKYHCVICWMHFNSAALMGNHMQKMHVSAELPFKCGLCDYMSSSLRHTIDHFYNDHTASGVLECPFCLKIFVAVANDQQLTANIISFLDHLKKHVLHTNEDKCKRCALTFLSKGANKLHQAHDHNSQKALQRHLREVCKNAVSIIKPKHKSMSTKEPVTYLRNYASLTLLLENGKVCLECDEDFQEDNHIISQAKCVKCNYQTACSSAISEHVANCTGTSTTETVPPCPLDHEFFCICGYSSTEGNNLARHLAACERKSAYESTDVAQQNTVKCNMLDMLGLVRRDGEDDEDSNEGLLIPADQQQQLISKSIEQSEPDDDGKDAEKTTDNEESQEKTAEGEPMDTEAMDQTDTPSLPPPTQQQANQQSSSSQPQPQQPMEDFNTQLSLDDLGPQSVAPQPEPDRTPQLSDEYQSLATPRVASYPPQYDQNEYEIPPNN